MPRSSSPRPARRRPDPGRKPGVGEGRPPPAHQRDLVHVCGVAAVRALFLRDPGRVERLFFQPQFAALLTAACRTLAAARKPYREVDAAELTRIAGTIRHGGVVAVARPRPLSGFDPEAAGQWARDGKLLLILDGIANPHNLGAIARSAAFFGLERIILSERAEQALPSDATYRVAAGGLEYVTLYRAPVPAALRALKGAYRVLAAAPEGGAPVRREAGGRPVALVLGNEERGLDKAVLAACDGVVRIPGSGRVESLNVAQAAAILLYALSGG